MTLTKPLPQLAAPAIAAALLLAAAPALAQPAGLPAVPTTRILAVGDVTPKFTPAALRTVLPEEARETVRLYLQGKIGDWYARKDRPGVVFILNVSDPKEAHDLLEALPFGREGLMTFQLIPMGPLAPLGLLLDRPAAPAAP
jgi:hypothetical protein